MNRHRNGTARSVVGSTVAAALLAGMVVPVGALATDIVISELMYHPADAAPVEFLELVNRGPITESLGGWCLATGIDLCFDAGTALAPGQRIVVTDNLTGFAAVYGIGVTPAGQYTGALGNGGDTIDLRDAAGSLIDSVTYDDAGAWPVAPDGEGPSLELRDLALDNDLAASWGTAVSPTGHTAGAVNSLEGLVTPTISEAMADPMRPNPGQAITVSARVDGTTNVNLVWREGFGNDQTLAMNDGPQSVGGTGDGVWSVVIPGQAAGKLVRYRIEAGAAPALGSVPAAGDTIDYEGVVVLDPAVDSNLPVLEWFMDDAVHADLLLNHRFDDVQGDAVIAYEGIVIDGVKMNIRGNSSRLADKVNWKVEFPKGHPFDMGGLLDRPVDEFNLQRGAFPEDELGWETARDAGMVSLQFFKIRTQRNASFYSVASYAGTYDGIWRDATGRSDWALYKAEKERGRALASEQALIDSGDWDKKEGDDTDWSDLHELTTVLDAPPTAAQRDWMWEHLDVPAMINYAATVAVVRHSDSSWYNYYVTNDTFGTGRWEMLLWDMDTLFVTDADDNDGDFLTPADNGQKFMIALMAHPEFRQMYMRRFRTLIDEKLTPDWYRQRAATSIATYTADYALERTTNGGRSIARFTQLLDLGTADRLRVVAENQGGDGSGLIPPSPSGDRRIDIVSVVHAPAGGDGFEYIALRNDSGSESIDLSGWHLTGSVDMTIPGGTVLNPGATGYLVANDPSFRASQGATRFVIGEFDGALPDDGGTLTLATRSGVTVDTANFPLGGGGDPTPVTFIGANDQWRYFDGVSAPATWASAAFDDAPWAIGSPEFGFGDGDEATLVSSTPLTTYYRRSFTVVDPAAVTELVASMKADDGAVVYVNGVAVANDNMPAGAITSVTPALSSRFGTDENLVRTFTLPTAGLQPGVNTVAVEVHNRWYNSSDVSFSLSLDGVVEGVGGGQPPGEVIGFGGQWRFFDGSTVAGNWAAAGFADGAWSLGAAEFGFGEGDETTVVSSTPLTTYYRRSFTIDDPAVVTQLVASIEADDGAVIYLNGVEVGRDNMPAGPIVSVTPAGSSRFGADEGVRRDLVLPRDALRAGSNVLAVEVHNRWYNSTDLSFDLRLRAD